jgi:hypothetical protein
VPTAPTGVSGTARSKAIRVVWTIPSSNGGSPITGYRIQKSVNGGAWSAVVSNTGSTATALLVTGLKPADRYRFRVAAINVAGAGPVSTPSAGIKPLA